MIPVVSQLSNIELGSDQIITLDEHSSSPATPASGKLAVYAKADGKLYIKDDAGNESALSDLEYVGNLQLDMADLLLHQSKLRAEKSPFRWEEPFVDDSNIDAGVSRSENYTFDAAGYVSNAAVTQFDFGAHTTQYVANDNRLLNLNVGFFSEDFKRVRVAFSTHANDTTFNNLFIGSQAPSGDVYDSDTDNTRITFDGGNNSTTILRDTDYYWSDWVDFEGDASVGINIAYDTDGTGSHWHTRIATPANVSPYKSSSDMAATQDRSGLSADTYIWFIAAIEIETVGDEMLVYSNPFTVSSAPDTAIVFGSVMQPDQNITMGTDLICAVARDSSENYVQLGSLLIREEGTSIQFLGTADLSSQPTGTELRTRFTTPTTATPKPVRVLGWEGFAE